MRAARKRIRADVEAEASVHDCGLVQAALGRANEGVDTPAAKALFKFFISNWSKKNGWSCKDVAGLAFLISESKGNGVEHLGVNPGLSGQNHFRKIKDALSLPQRIRKECTFVSVPVWNTRTEKRTVRQMPIRNPHEVVNKNFLHRPERYNLSRLDPDDWDVPLYTQHPLVQEHGVDNVKALGMYSDKVTLSKTDTFYRMSVGLVWSKVRHTVWVVLSSELCKCGCNGKCTLDTLQLHVNHSVNAMQDGVEPMGRQNADFAAPDDQHRIDVAGKPMPTGRFALVEHRADWPERAMVAGLKNHSGKRPCMSCSCLNTKLFQDLGDCSLLAMPVTWVANTHGVYLEQLRKQLVKIHLVNDEARDLLISNLRIRKAHPWGREVVSSSKTRHMGLRNGDRLVTGTDNILTLHNDDLVFQVAGRQLHCRNIFTLGHPGGAWQQKKRFPSFDRRASTFLFVILERLSSLYTLYAVR